MTGSRRLIRYLGALALLSCPLTLSGGAQPAGDIQMLPLGTLTEDREAQFSVLGARKVDPQKYAAIFYARDLQCTSSLVGPHVLLTAAHCVANGGRVTVTVDQKPFTATCTHADEYHPRRNRSADYALCLFETAIGGTPYFETVNIDPARLTLGKDVLITGFGCSKEGGGGDTSGSVFRVGEAKIKALPSNRDNRLITDGKAAVCYGDSGGPTFLQRLADGGPRIQISVNAIGNILNLSALASLSTPTARKFLLDWSTKHDVTICGVSPTATKCKEF